MEVVIGDNLICPTVAGDDAYVTYGHCLAVVLHALEAVPFLLNSPKDTALARISVGGGSTVGVKEDARGLSMPEWAKHCADLRKSKSLSARSKHALTLGVNDFFHHETWVPDYSAVGTGPAGVDLPPTEFLREPASLAILHLTWAGDLAFASGDSLAPTARLFGYTGGLITCAQRTAMGQADLVLCDLFCRPSQGANTSVPEEDAIEITDGWRNSQWPDCMVTLPKAGAASTVDLKRMFEYWAGMGGIMYIYMCMGLACH
jgi:hypothetical protein